MTNPSLWLTSNDGKYKYCSFSHQPARNDINVLGTPFWPTTLGSDNAPVSVWSELSQLATLYRTAQLVRITYELYPPVNWRFASGETSTTIFGEGTSSTTTYTSNIHPMSCRIFHCMLHEMPNGTISDNSNQQTITPGNLLGWNARPDLFHPDRETTLDGSTRGREKFEKLFEDRRIKIFQGQRRRKVVWLPVTRFDKMYTRFDLDRISNSIDGGLGTTDDDQRCGASWWAVDWSSFAPAENISQSAIQALPFMMKVKFAFLCIGRT